MQFSNMIFFQTPILGSASAQAKYNMDPKWNNTLYFTAYCRFHTYGVGLLLGIVLHDLKKVESFLEKMSIKARALFCPPMLKISENIITKRLEYKAERFNYNSGSLELRYKLCSHLFSL